MPNFKLEISIEIPDDLDIDTVEAVSQREDVQAMLVNLAEGMLISIAQNDRARTQALGEPPLASEATRRINLLPLDLLKATALTNDYGRLSLPPLVDAIVGEVLDLHEEGQNAISAGDYVYALALAELGEEKISRIPKLP